MDYEFNRVYTKATIVEDGSGGQISVTPITRHGAARKTKLQNNFIGLLQRTDPSLLFGLCRRLTQQLPQPIPGELVVGMYISGVVVATLLAFARESAFTWSSPESLGDSDSVICYNQDQLGAKPHYLYSVKPGDRVILIEDEVTSGRGLAGLAKVLQEHKVEVLAISSILETVNFGGREHIKTETGLDLVSLTKIELS